MRNRITPTTLFALNVLLWFVTAVIAGPKYGGGFAMAMLFPGAFAAGYFLKSRSFMGCVNISLWSAVLADIILILFETTFVDKTSHNLAPFELVGSAVVGFGMGIFGVAAARLYMRIK